jgi:hypothetical protein
MAGDALFPKVSGQLPGLFLRDRAVNNHHSGPELRRWQFPGDPRIPADNGKVADRHLPCPGKLEVIINKNYSFSPEIQAGIHHPHFTRGHFAQLPGLHVKNLFNAQVQTVWFHLEADFFPVL